MRCICGCEDFKRKGNGVIEEGYLVEYSTYCADCDNHIMTCAYGSEDYNEDNVVWE